MMKVAGLFLLNVLLCFCLFSSCTRNQNVNEKLLMQAVNAKIKGFDPAHADDKFSNDEIGKVYEGLYEYHYLKRPIELEPNLADGLPEISKDGKTYTIKIKKGVFFHDDKSFSNGIGRELEAQDFVYSIKRLADPKIISTGWWLFEGRIKGLDAWKKTQEDKKETDYDSEVEGLRALDKYTLRIVLNEPFPQLLNAFCMGFTFVVSREAVEYYGKEFLNHPVGTGPFFLPVFNQDNRIVYYKNPKYRRKLYPNEGAPEFVAAGYLKDAGKPLPLIDKIIVEILIEDQPRWLNFLTGKHDWLQLPKDNFGSALDMNLEVLPDMKKKGIEKGYSETMDVTYMAFNHTMPLFQNKKLRQAMSLAVDSQESNKLFYNNTAVVAQSVIPPGLKGHNKDYKNPYVGPDIEKAKKLLAEAGYPGGKGLPEITYDGGADTTSRQLGELFTKQMAEIGIRIKFISNPWPELQKKTNTKSAQMWGIAWGADYPDAETFLQLFYGPNEAPGSNGSCYKNKEYDALYEKIRVMQDTPERTLIYEKMNQMLSEEMPVLFNLHRQRVYLVQGWVENYIAAEGMGTGWEQYYNINLAKKKELLRGF